MSLYNLSHIFKSLIPLALIHPHNMTDVCDRFLHRIDVFLLAQQ